MSGVTHSWFYKWGSPGRGAGCGRAGTGRLPPRAPPCLGSSRQGRSGPRAARGLAAGLKLRAPIRGRPRGGGDRATGGRDFGTLRGSRAEKAPSWPPPEPRRGDAGSGAAAAPGAEAAAAQAPGVLGRLEPLSRRPRGAVVRAGPGPPTPGAAGGGPVRSLVPAMGLQVLTGWGASYEQPPPGLIKEDEAKPEDCIPDVPGNEHAREFLAHAPTKGLWMPLGKEVKVMQFTLQDPLNIGCCHKVYLVYFSL
ncbi:uncharacterized protein LOC144578307 [Callithrix jacchus]